MTFQQVRQILKQMEFYHHSLRMIVVEFLDTDLTLREDRREWLVRYVDIQSLAISDAMARFQVDGECRVLDTWIQFIPDADLQRRLDELQALTDANQELLLEHVLGVDQEIRNLYTTLAAQSSARDVQELFLSLSRYSQSVLEQTAWGMRPDDDAADRDEDVI